MASVLGTVGGMAARRVGGSVLAGGKAAAGAAALGTGAFLRQAASPIPGGTAAMTAGLGIVGAMGSGLFGGGGGGKAAGKSNGTGGGTGAVTGGLEKLQEGINKLIEINKAGFSDVKIIKHELVKMRELAYEEARKSLKKIQKPSIGGAGGLAAAIGNKKTDSTGFNFLPFLPLLALPFIGPIVKFFEEFGNIFKNSFERLKVGMTKWHNSIKEYFKPKGTFSKMLDDLKKFGKENKFGKLLTRFGTMLDDMLDKLKGRFPKLNPFAALKNVKPITIPKFPKAIDNNIVKPIKTIPKVEVGRPWGERIKSTISKWREGFARNSQDVIDRLPRTGFNNQVSALKKNNWRLSAKGLELVKGGKIVPNLGAGFAVKNFAQYRWAPGSGKSGFVKNQAVLENIENIKNIKPVVSGPEQGPPPKPRSILSRVIRGGYSLTGLKHIMPSWSSGMSQVGQGSHGLLGGRYNPLKGINNLIQYAVGTIPIVRKLVNIPFFGTMIATALGGYDFWQASKAHEAFKNGETGEAGQRHGVPMNDKNYKLEIARIVGGTLGVIGFGTLGAMMGGPFGALIGGFAGYAGGGNAAMKLMEWLENTKANPLEGFKSKIDIFNDRELLETKHDNAFGPLSPGTKVLRSQLRLKKGLQAIAGDDGGRFAGVLPTFLKMRQRKVRDLNSSMGLNTDAKILSAMKNNVEYGTEIRAINSQVLKRAQEEHAIARSKWLASPEYKQIQDQEKKDQLQRIEDQKDIPFGMANVLPHDGELINDKNWAHWNAHRFA